MERVAKERLIAAVRPYECLWNRNNADFLHPIVKRECWKEVIDELDPTWKNKSKAAKEHLLKQYMKLWMGIRGHYRRQKRNGKLDLPINKRRASYCRMLTFLDQDEEANVEETGCHKFERSENENENGNETAEYLESDIEEELDIEASQSQPTTYMEAFSRNLSKELQPTADLKEPLIAAIRSHECLWNVNVEGYMQPVLRRQAWMEVGRALGQGWDSLTSAEQEHLVKEYQKKWQNMRDYYNKLKRSGVLKRRWKQKRALHLKKLSFLYDDGEYQTYRETATSEGNETAEYLETNFEEMPGNAPEAVKGFETPANATEAALTPLETNLLTLLKTRSPDEDRHMSADRHFMLSLLPEVEKMSADESLEFKVTVLNAIKDIKRRRCELNKDEGRDGEVRVQLLL